MAAHAANYLKGTNTVFFLVGSAHLVGDKGVVKILTDHSYNVQQSGIGVSSAGANNPANSSR